MDNQESQQLSLLVATLFKGVIYREDNLSLWQSLLNMQAAIRDYIRLLGLELIFDEAEGYAFLKSQQDSDENGNLAIPRLMARRPLSFPVSLILALLRKKLVEFDASGAETRLILNRDDIVELVRVFLPENTNEVKLITQIDVHINKIITLGFLRRLQGTMTIPNFEVRRILKAFVDAQWLAEFDQRLMDYRDYLSSGQFILKENNDE